MSDSEGSGGQPEGKGSMPTYLAYLPKGMFSPTSDTLKIKMIKRKMQFKPEVVRERPNSNSPPDESEEKDREKGIEGIQIFMGEEGIRMYKTRGKEIRGAISHGRKGTKEKGNKRRRKTKPHQSRRRSVMLETKNTISSITSPESTRSTRKSRYRT